MEPCMPALFREAAAQLGAHARGRISLSIMPRTIGAFPSQPGVERGSRIACRVCGRPHGASNRHNGKVGVADGRSGVGIWTCLRTGALLSFRSGRATQAPRGAFSTNAQVTDLWYY